MTIDERRINLEQSTETPSKRVSIKFLFKNEVEHTYRMMVKNKELADFHKFLINACKSDWMMIPDDETPGRFVCIKTEELVCFEASLT